ncbi:MAG: hypothetical protein GDA56_16840 [Hormoscilla sp. GM7CHS1pb]|nr:hypothetical protein [Hormoscilla sp. GM7CHS1pb]
MWEEVKSHVSSQIEDGWIECNKELIQGICFEYYVHHAAVASDFFRAVLNVNPDPWRWQLFQDLVKSCGIIFPYENVCLACDRPVSSPLTTDNCSTP